MERTNLTTPAADLTTTATESPSARPTSLPYNAPLDGLRGLTLVSIILYHAGSGWAPGAFLGVSTFFTLSGFLIVALMLAEQSRDGSVSLRSFWSRRLRRLMPAAFATIFLITVASAWLADSTQLARLRGDALAALGYVANWRFVLQGDTYGADFDSPSPFTHFWTLAIEEQLYVLLPLIIVTLLVLAKGSRRVLAAGLVVLTAASLGWSTFLESQGVETSRMYFGTDVRVAELLSGALLALWWMRRTSPLSPRASTALAYLTPVGLAAMVVLWATQDLENRIYYRGGLLAYSCLTLFVIVGCLNGRGPAARLMSWKPLVWVGTVSYAAYLVHFPVLLWLEHYTSLGVGARIVVSLPIVFGLAAISSAFFEGPIRRRTMLRTPARAAAAVAIGVVVVAGTAIGVTTVMDIPDQATLDQIAQWHRYVEMTEAQDRSDAPRIGVFGDSTALMTGRGLSSRSLENPEHYVTTPGHPVLGCGLAETGRRVVRGETMETDAECVGWREAWAQASAENPSDLAVVQLGPWEVVEQEVEPGSGLAVLGEDPELNDAVRRRLRDAVEILLVDNGRVVFIAPPDIDVGRVDGRSPSQPHPESDPARMQFFRDLIDEVAGEYELVDVVQMDDWLASRDDDRQLRPDGVHFTDESSLVVADWLGPELVELYRERTGMSTTQVAR